MVELRMVVGTFVLLLGLFVYLAWLVVNVTYGIGILPLRPRIILLSHTAFAAAPPVWALAIEGDLADAVPGWALQVAVLGTFLVRWRLVSRPRPSTAEG